ncbi:MAG: hypothetical protein AAGK47_05190 [Bacteroidota bacterium]
MAKKTTRRSKTADFSLNKNPRPPIDTTSQADIEKQLAEIQGRVESGTPNAPMAQPLSTDVPTARVQREAVSQSATPVPPPTFPQQKIIQAQPIQPTPPPPPAPPKEKRVPLTTAITPENRALLEVASLYSDASVADMINEALGYYFTNLVKVQDQAQVEMFKQIYARKAR